MSESNKYQHGYCIIYLEKHPQRCKFPLRSYTIFTPMDNGINGDAKKCSTIIHACLGVGFSFKCQ